MRALLSTARRQTSVSVPLRRDNGEIEVLIGHRVQHNLSRGSAKGGLSLRHAATCIAVERVADAHRRRGLYP